MLKCVVQLKNCWIGTQIGVLVDIDTPIMIVVCSKICGKSVVNICGKNCGEIEKLSDLKKNWCGKKKIIIIIKTLSCRIVEQGGQWPLQF